MRIGQTILDPQSSTLSVAPAALFLNDLYRFLLRRLDREDLVEPRDLDEFHQSRPDAAEDQLAVLERRQLLVEVKHDADSLAGEVRNFLEVQDNSALILLVNEVVYRVGNFFKLDRVHQGRRAELDDGEFLDLLDRKVRTSRRRREFFQAVHP